ncbi:hypothetical protein QBC45DRAFT_426289 [Copromyces sp. CBS 386.78]|nr:hypothetical protein QBC45DRAFT_426289 [Copromyces sp. CBS 386.78]
MEFTRSNSDGSYPAPKRRRVEVPVDEGRHRQQRAHRRHPPSYPPARSGPSYNGPSSTYNPMLGVLHRQDQITPATDGDLLGTRTSNNSQSDIFSSNQRDDSYSPTDTTAFFNPFIQGDDCPRDCPLRTPQKALTGYQDIVRTDNKPQSRVLSPTLLDDGYQPMRHVASGHPQRVDNVLGANAVTVDEPKISAHPLEEFEAWVRGGEWKELFSQPLTNAPSSPSFTNNAPGQGSAGTFSNSSLIDHSGPLSTSQPLLSNHDFGRSNSNWEESLRQELQASVMSNNFGFAAKEVLPNTPLFQGVNSLGGSVHGQEELGQVAQRSTNSFGHVISITDQPEQLVGPNGSPSSEAQHFQHQPLDYQAQIQQQQLQHQHFIQHQLPLEDQHFIQHQLPIEDQHFIQHQLPIEDQHFIQHQLPIEGQHFIQNQPIQPPQAAPADEDPPAAEHPIGPQGQGLKICRKEGCNRPRLYQTNRSRFCQEHMDNSMPGSRTHLLDQDTMANDDMCSGCHGLRPRRAPGELCWDCFCKGRRKRQGCDGCPALKCPNRIVEEE